MPTPNMGNIVCDVVSIVGTWLFWSGSLIVYFSSTSHNQHHVASIPLTRDILSLVLIMYILPMGAQVFLQCDASSMDVLIIGF